ncbi:RGG repeats nuclear RNA binding protein A-like [Iris pallida]|uniref:RGG repeats nuclear RNA binding protein A-like n=1 Tax=Iris pallida TaxID=29817 RepID=A0AAX6HP12_IRIPA|nr:RGG repeats nuclear RNA binding protein A-like [Iris pallida]
MMARSRMEKVSLQKEFERVTVHHDNLSVVVDEVVMLMWKERLPVTLNALQGEFMSVGVDMDVGMR